MDIPCNIPAWVILLQIVVGIGINLVVAVVFYQVGKQRASRCGGGGILPSGEAASEPMTRLDAIRVRWVAKREHDERLAELITSSAEGSTIVLPTEAITATARCFDTASEDMAWLVERFDEIIPLLRRWHRQAHGHLCDSLHCETVGVLARLEAPDA